MQLTEPCKHHRKLSGMELGVADLGEIYLSAAPECQPLGKFRGARGGSHAVRVGFCGGANWVSLY